MGLDIDFSLPLATLLRESTRKSHESVENSPGAVFLLSGRLERDEYVRYLMMLWYIYDTFERALNRHATHPTLEPTYNPTLLARAPALAADISYLLQVPESSWKSHPTHRELRGSMPSPLSAYISRIDELSDAADPSPLLAHSYVRYLGDLSGGQTIRRIIGKAYNLDEDVGLGLSFYAFKELRSAKPASQGEMKRIKDWFRAGMNTAGEQGVEVKASVVAEANTAFDLNAALFSTIRTGSSDGADASEESKAGEIPDIIERTSPLQKTYPISQVVAVIAAVCLAHFILVTGGLLGDKGYQKLLAVENWFERFWQSGTPE